MIPVKVKDNQSVWDLALMYYGDSGGLQTLLEDNIALNLTDTPVPGTTIYIDENKVQNKKVLAFINTNEVIPATALSETLEEISNREFSDEFSDEFN